MQKLTVFTTEIILISALQVVSNCHVALIHFSCMSLQTLLYLAHKLDILGRCLKINQ